MAQVDANEKLQKISEELNEHIIAVKGALELIDASIEVDELNDLIMKSVTRMDFIQKLTSQLIAILRQYSAKTEETKS